MIRLFGYAFGHPSLTPVHTTRKSKDAPRTPLFLKKTAAYFPQDRLIFPIGIFMISTLFLVSAPKAWSFFTPSELVAEEHIVSIGKGTERLLLDLKQIDINSRVVAKVRRLPEFSAEGVIIGLDGDSLQVFEYPDATLAHKEALAFLSQYKKPHWKNDWAPPLRLYQKDSLIVYYMGTSEAIASGLDNTMGFPNSGTSSVATSSTYVASSAKTTKR